MVGTRRSRKEPLEIAEAVVGEERQMKNKEAMVVVLDDEEGSLGCGLTMEIAKLRERWELASVLNFLNVFESVVWVNLKISAEDIEMGLVNPNNSLAQLHITLLKGIPPVSKTLDVSDAWITVLCKKLAPWWPWVAEGEVPLRAAKGEEISRYKGLNPIERLMMLKALCEIRVDQEDTVAYISDALKQGTPITSFRKEKIKGDGNGISYWYDGNEIIGYRLYREVTVFDSKIISKGKRFLDQSTLSSHWETLATNLQEFCKVVDALSSSKVETEATAGRIVKADAIPVLQKLQKDKERVMKRKQRQEMLLNDLRTSHPVGVTRSCRNRRPVNYTFDDYDQSIDKAIKLFKKRRNAEEQNQEMKNTESRNSNFAASDGASDRNTNSGCSDKENDKPGGSDDSLKRNESADIDTNYNQEVYSGDENNVSEDKKHDTSKDLRFLGTEVDMNKKGTDCAAMSIRLAGGNSQPVVETRNLGTKNRLRQRPLYNSALDSIFIPDSESDNSSEDANRRESGNEIPSQVSDLGDVGD